MRGCWRRFRLLSRREPDHKAGTGHGRLAAGTGWANAIFGPDPSAMGVHDLLRDRQAKSGILPEALMRPVGVEAFEYPREGVFANAGSVVVDDDFDVRAP